MFRLIHSSVCAVFFFKQKTAYEMRICDWSSDVCSSDLLAHALALVAGEPARKSKGDYLAARRALDYLQANSTRVVALEELEAATGRDRWSLSRDFRLYYGTSPYRYLTMRRLDIARRLLLADQPLATAAAEAGFADQSHMSRHFLK